MAQSGPGTGLIPAAIVVPVVNEALTLPYLLEAIAQQTQRPAELVFIDGGSRDGSAALIKDWWRQSGWSGAQCTVLANPGGLPGGNRNVGVRHAGQPWIAFLDGGIEPARDWLEQLLQHATNTSSRAVSGMCRFDGTTAVELAVCALSSGAGAVAPVLPASLFRREIFSETGFFRDDLRSAEDLEWLRRLAHAGIERSICANALVSYRHFPDAPGDAIRKWFLYEKNTTLAGVRRTQQNAYLAALAVLLLTAVLSLPLAIVCTGVYWLARGIADPIRRSRSLWWWNKAPTAFIYAAMLGPCLDLAKLAGIIVSLPQRK